MALSHASTFQPYLDRKADHEQMGEVLKIITSNLCKFFPNADRVEQLIHRKDEVEVLFRELGKGSTENRIIAHDLRMKKFYYEVFELDITDEYIIVPYIQTLRYRMHVSEKLSPDKLLVAAHKLFGRVEFQSTAIDGVFERRTSKGYLFAYNGYDVADKKLLLQEEQTIEILIKRKFIEREYIGSDAMNCFEYLLCAMFKYWLKTEYFDSRASWTLFPHVIGIHAVIAQTEGIHYIFRLTELTAKGTHPPIGLRGIYLFGV